MSDEGQRDPGVEPAEEQGPPAAKLPGWVAPAIGVALVLMAALAIYTGMRYRGAGLGRQLIPERVLERRRPPVQPSTPPGEPEPGASRQGISGGVTPQANPITATAPRMQIKNEGSGLIGSSRLNARRGVRFQVVPSDAVVYVNNVAIGSAKQFSTSDEVYDFPDEGSFTIRLVAPGYREAEYIVNADASAPDELATISTRLQKE
ncbi:MAG TPA: hypothetical protein VHL58_15625 [Thermoanaerobaculia bacterium]|nr:hypothetical protein [Thermoanaerobaculia bacterium]